tara:strand:+ start:3341 stop:3577 length:237 start_codon:yes stop_codon:yes gene_type:complete
MKVFIIAIILWWGNPTMKPEADSVEVETLHNKPLFFNTEKECQKHIEDNLEALKGFGRRVFPTANAVKAILCIERDKT